MSLFQSEMQLTAQLFALMEQANLLPRVVSKAEPLPVDTFDTELNGERITVQIMAIDNSCHNCNGQCEAGGPYDCPTCDNSGQAELPKITLGRAWTADKHMLPVKLDEDDKETIAARYVREVL